MPRTSKKKDIDPKDANFSSEAPDDEKASSDRVNEQLTGPFVTVLKKATAGKLSPRGEGDIIYMAGISNGKVYRMARYICVLQTTAAEEGTRKNGCRWTQSVMCSPHPCWQETLSNRIPSPGHSKGRATTIPDSLWRFCARKDCLPLMRISRI